MAKKDFDPFDVAVGARVRLARELASVRAVDLGRHLGLEHPSSVYRNEAGVRGFTTHSLVQIAALLRVSIDWLLTGRQSEYGAPRDGSGEPVSAEDELFVREYVGKSGNTGKGVLDLEHALAVDRYRRAPSPDKLAKIASVAERLARTAGVKRVPRAGAGPRRRKHDSA